MPSSGGGTKLIRTLRGAADVGDVEGAGVGEVDATSGVASCESTMEADAAIVSRIEIIFSNLLKYTAVQRV